MNKYKILLTTSPEYSSSLYAAVLSPSLPRLGTTAFPLD